MHLIPHSPFLISLGSGNYSSNGNRIKMQVNHHLSG